MDKARALTPPLVSVLMTVYNRERYIAEAIESVLASSYQNWELIIVDDGSEDDSVQIARSFQLKDQRIIVYINERNLGDYPNRNRAAKYANGKYLKYLDADDLIYPYGLELMVNYMEQFPKAGYGLCSLNQDKKRIFPFELSPHEAYTRHYIDRNSLFHKAPLSSLIRKTAFEAIGGFTGKQYLGDFEMWHRLSKIYPVVLMPHGIVWYREHENQQMNAYRNDPHVPFKYLILAEKLVNSNDCPLGETEKVSAGKWIKYKKFKAVLAAAKDHSLGKAIELHKAGNNSLSQVFKRH